MVLRDEYRIQAQQTTNHAWAYPKGADQGLIERDQDKWEYAVEECAGRLRAEAALRAIGEALDHYIRQHRPLLDEMLGALHQANKLLGPDPAPGGSVTVRP